MDINNKALHERTLPVMRNGAGVAERREVKTLCAGLELSGSRQGVTGA